MIHILCLLILHFGINETGNFVQGIGNHLHDPVCRGAGRCCNGHHPNISILHNEEAHGSHLHACACAATKGSICTAAVLGEIRAAATNANADLVVAEISLGDAYPYRVAVKEGDPKGLLESINKSIAKMLADGSMEMFISDANAMSVAALEG